MANQYLLGIDNGNTVTKAALFDLRGRELYVASRSADTIQPHPGWTERSMGTLWSNTAQAIRELIQRAGISGSEIAAVGCTGHGNGLYLLDKSFKSCRNAVQSMDTRASDILRDWEANHLRERVAAYTPQETYTGQTVVLLAWLKRHEPETYAQIGKVLLCKDYINFCLTGELVSDYTDISGANLFDVYNRCYSPELLALFGIPEIEDALPPMKASAEVIGRVTQQAAEATGLAAGTPVIAGMLDTHASAIGAGVCRPGQACIVVGTWSINQIVLKEPLRSTDLFLMQPFADSRYWLAMEASATSASNLEWFVNQFCADERMEAQRRGISVYDVCNEAVASIPAEESSVIFLPFLYSANLPAGFHGLAGWHTRAHALRAVYEGIAFSHLAHIEKLRRAGASFEKARLTGGGARSAVWGQMFADLLGMSMEIPDGFETGTRGAALAAGVGAKIYADFDEAVSAAVSLARTHEPDPHNTPIYQQRYEEYKQLVTRLAS